MGAWLELFLLPKLSISQRFLPKQMPKQMSRAFGSAQGPATPTRLLQTYLQICRALLGEGMPGAQLTEEFAGETAAGRDGAQGSHGATLTSSQSCFLQANTSAFRSA